MWVDWLVQSPHLSFLWPLYWSTGVLQETKDGIWKARCGEIQRRDVVSVDELQYMTWLLQYTTALMSYRSYKLPNSLFYRWNTLFISFPSPSFLLFKLGGCRTISELLQGCRVFGFTNVLVAVCYEVLWTQYVLFWQTHLKGSRRPEEIVSYAIWCFVLTEA
jgi:hypothetical protein